MWPKIVLREIKKDAKVRLEKIYQLPCNDGKVVYVTFDAGNTHSGNVVLLLKLLEQENIKATFFLSGKWVLLHPISARRIAQSNHSLANHSFTHYHQTHLPRFANFWELKTTELIINEICGREPLLLFRPPHGDTNKELESYIASLGYRTIMWSKDPSDWRLDGSVTKESILDRIGRVKNGDIIVFHLRNKETIEALKILIRRLKKEQFKFKTLDDIKL